MHQDFIKFLIDFVENTLPRILSLSIISWQSLASTQCFKAKLVIGRKPGRLLGLIGTPSRG